MALDEFGVRFAFPAIEGVRALPTLELAGQHVAAHLVASGHAFKIGMPADRFRLVHAQGAP